MESTPKAPSDIGKRSTSATRLSGKGSPSTPVSQNKPLSTPNNGEPAKKAGPRTKPKLESGHGSKPTPEQAVRKNEADKGDVVKKEEEPSAGEVSANPKVDSKPTQEGKGGKEPEKAATLDQAAVLRNRPFILRTVRHYGAEGGQSTGSILSQSLDKLLQPVGRTDAGSLTMAGLRKLVPSMSRFVEIDKFCTPSGTFIDDEAISFVDYLGLEGAPEAPAAGSGAPSIKLYFRSTKIGDSANKGADGGDASTYKGPSLSEEPKVKAVNAPFVENLKSDAMKHDLIKVSEFATGADANPGAGTLNENQWAVVLRNCAVFYGWNMDPRSRRIVRAPKAAFQLRSKVNLQAVAKIPDFVANSAAANQIAAAGSGANDAAASATGPLAADPSVPAGAESSVTAASGDSVSGGEPNGLSDGSSEGTEKLTFLVPKSDKGIPNFRVSDDSRIEITAHETDLSVSMAKSDFSEQSTEASVSGGGYGVSVGVSAGYASSKSNTSKTFDNSTSTMLVGRYMFPRCDLLLWPDELEPTPELAALIENIRSTKDIKSLRKLHAEYGHLFCQNITLGGRLLTTKTVTSTEHKTLDEQKESFKTSVGAAVSGSYGGFSASASVKHEQANGSTNLNETSARQQGENAVFEAVGGDTILANNPAAWGPTVGRSDLWRVINRDGLKPLADILSAMPGFAAVQSWFVQAVPALSQYMVLDEAHQCRARLRVISPTNSLSIANTNGNAAFYLGHDDSEPVTPSLNGVNTSSQEVFWMRIDISEDIPIFNPPTYRAPAILGYENFDIEGTKYGAAYNAPFTKSEWTIIAPFDEALKHGTRVILRTSPYQDPSKEPEPGKPVATINASHMVVFRNAQGQFLPAMSDSDEYQCWRLIKTDTSQPFIKPGDEVRLAWDFHDQTTGWRDFSQDVFGRREVCAPNNAAAGPLLLKVPWPRFETTGKPTALIMSAEQGDLASKPMTVNLKGTPATFNYCMQDVRLRIDAVGSGGRGDADDYLLNKVEQKGPLTHISIKQATNPLQIRQSMFMFGIF